MTNISKRIEQIVRKELSQTIIPVKTAEGILVGDVLIKSKEHFKSLYKRGELLYEGIHLNSVAIALANMLSFKQHDVRIDAIYRADQEYGRYFTDSQQLRAMYQKAMSNKNFDRADIFWARYDLSRERAVLAKDRVERLLNI